MDPFDFIMGPLDFISKYFWLMALVATGASLAMVKLRSTNRIRQNPELAEGYSTLFRRYLIDTTIPVLVMAIGFTVGKIPTIWYYFRPRDGNPYVLAWFASIFFFAIVEGYWLFFKGGAEMLTRHPGAFNMNFASPLVLKLFWLLGLSGAILATIFMLVMNFPSFSFR